MKNHLTRLRPVLLLAAVCLLLFNCSDDYNMTTTAIQGRQPVSTAKRLTGREARQQVNELVNELSKDGKKGLTKLMRSIDTGNSSNMRTTLQDIKPYIDSTEVLLLTDTVHHKRNYTYRLRHPDATKTTFYNLVMREYNGHRRLTLITYKMGTTFAQDFYATGDLSKFTGQVVFEIIAQDEGDPCEETPPASGGGGGGVWIANPYDGVYIPPSNVNEHQYMVKAHLMELGMASAGSYDDGEFYTGEPNHWVNRMAFNLNSPTDDGDPCNEDEVAVLPQHIDHTKRLKMLTNNKPDGSKTNIKEKIDQLKSRLATTNGTPTIKEDGAMYDENQTPLAPSATGGNYTKWYNVPDNFYITLHMHQDKYYKNTPNQNPVLTSTNPVQSDIDVFNLLKLYDYTGNSNATAMFVSRLGTFALVIENPAQANAAFNALFENLNDESKDFTNKYDGLVTSHYVTNPNNEQVILNGYINFINNHQVNGQSMGLAFYQATYDGNGNITEWHKL